MARSKTTKPKTTKPKAEAEEVDAAAAESKAVESTESTEAENSAKAVAEENAEETRAEPSVEEKRERRAEILQELREADAERTERLVAEADEAGLHKAKLDDAGAAEQQRVARESNLDLQNELGELTGAPVTAPVLDGSPGSFRIVSRRDSDRDNFEEGVDYVSVDSSRFVGFNLHIVGDGFPAPGEVVIDIRRSNGQDHQRFSAWTDDGRIDTVLPGINGVGDWDVHLESLVTQVGEGREDHLPLIKETETVSIELY